MTIKSIKKKDNERGYPNNAREMGRKNITYNQLLFIPNSMS